MTKVCVVVPVYKNLSKDERIRILRAKEVFSRRVFIIVTHDENLAEGLSEKIILVEKKYLSSIHSYNDLLMLKKFYDLFVNYEYMLICQDDVVVFNDFIDEFIGCSYIGAIFREPKVVNSYYFGKFPRVGHLLSRFGIGYKFNFGNGGLSLRNINFCRENAYHNIKNNLSKSKFLKEIIMIREDIFWMWKAREKMSCYEGRISKFGYDNPKMENGEFPIQTMGIHGTKYMSTYEYKMLMNMIC